MGDAISVSILHADPCLVLAALTPLSPVLSSMNWMMIRSAKNSWMTSSASCRREVKVVAWVGTLAKGSS